MPCAAARTTVPEPALAISTDRHQLIQKRSDGPWETALVTTGRAPATTSTEAAQRGTATPSVRVRSPTTAEIGSTAASVPTSTADPGVA
ncbi:hypothetical protein GALL_438880 [mine drainage metagenome]|uniref:Uncharacterized protein n=1 Tax=mine drainage metagenome TaxID=410659 RepID=A0A1J5QAD3_9ZZZZ